MENTPLFSVLVANYNNGSYLEESIQSIYDQTYINWEIIIVDDCSSDNSQDIYKKYEKDPRIKIFYNNSNRGCGYTKNRCVSESAGLICGFLDPDDILSSNALEKMVEAHDNMPEISLIHSRFFYCDEHLNVTSELKNITLFDQKDLFFFNQSYSIRPFATFKRKYYDLTNGIEPYLQRAVDQDLYLKLYEVAPTFYLNEPLYYYRIHDAGISTFGNVEKALYWHWVVIIDAAKRRNINVEKLFCSEYTASYKTEQLQFEFNKLQKYRSLNKFLSKMKSYLKFSK